MIIGYLSVIFSDPEPVGLGRKEFLLRSHTAKERPVVDPVDWFVGFDIAKTLRLIKGDPEVIAAWRAIAERVPAT